MGSAWMRWWACSLAVVIAGAHAQESLVEEDQHFWTALAKEELESALKLRWNDRTAKNVILFIGDGMDPNTVTASRIYKGNEQSKLSFEEFPHIGLLKTYSVDKQVPDSASTASALFSGVKINFQTMGVDSRVKLRDCAASLDERNRIKSILQWAQDAGKATGFVTNTRVTHATPGALFAHSADRKWECDGKMPKEASACKDIARQLVEELPGKNINVIMGGGRQCLQTNFTVTEADPIDSWGCVRKDNRDLIDTWVQDKRSRKLRYRLLNNTGDLVSLDVRRADYVMGIFANGHMAYDYIRDGSKLGMPSLKQMTVKAVEILQKNPAGYVLMVEGGLIDQAHHRGYAKRALNETLGFDEAIKEALDMVKKNQRKGKNTFIHDEVKSDTLIIVTSDHAHSLSINGYPKRGNSILGLAQTSPVDNIPYTTLGYATGDLHAFNYTVTENGTKVTRADPTTQDYKSFDYHQQAAIYSDEEYHGGGDVAVYATGPMAHLFHNLHEQHYVAHVIAYAAKIGPYSPNGSNQTPINLNLSLICALVCLILGRFIS